MKKRTIALMLSVLAVLMLVGVGFATWVISQGADADQTGSLVVDGVTDNRLNVSFALKDSDDGKFNFTGAANDAFLKPWLTNPENPNAEKKSVTFVVSVTKQDGSAFTTKPTIKYTLSENEIQAAGLVELNGLNVDQEYTIDESAITLENSGKTAKAEITISYKWGNVFGGENPYTFFNSKTVNGKISTTDVNNASAAGLTYGEPAAALTTDNNYGDLAHAALEKLAEKNTKTVKVTVNVTL